MWFDRLKSNEFKINIEIKDAIENEQLNYEDHFKGTNFPKNTWSKNKLFLGKHLTK